MGGGRGVHVSSSPLMYFDISLCERQVSNTNVFIAEGGRILKLGEGNNIGRWTNNFLNLFKLSLFKYISMYVISLLCVVFFDHDLMIGQRDRETQERVRNRDEETEREVCLLICYRVNIKTLSFSQHCKRKRNLIICL